MKSTVYSSSGKGSKGGGMRYMTVGGATRESIMSFDES